MKEPLPEPTESEIKNEICRLLDTFPDRCQFTVSPPRRGKYLSRYMRDGWPDISGDWDGKCLMIEVKKPDGRITMAQYETLERNLKRGGVSIIASSVEDVRKRLGV